MEFCSNARPRLGWEQRLALVLPLVSLAQRPIGERRRSTPRGLPVTLQALASSIARQHGIGEASLWRWYGRYQAQGPLGLLRAPRADCGKSRYFARYPQLGAVAGRHLAAGRSAALAHLALRASCSASGIPVCGIKTVRRQAALLRGRAASRRLQ